MNDKLKQYHLDCVRYHHVKMNQLHDKALKHSDHSFIKAKTAHYDAAVAHRRAAQYGERSSNAIKKSNEANALG